MQTPDNQPFMIRQVALGSAGETNPEAGAVVMRTSQGAFDISPLFQMQVELGDALGQFQRNPYDHRPLVRMRNVGQRAMPMLQQIRSNPALASQFGSMGQHVSSMLKTVQGAAKLRIKAAHDMARRPLQLVPISLGIGFGTSQTGIQIRNPYLGSTGGVAVSDTFRAPWSVTAFRTSNNENGQLQPIRITQWLIGGHDYVAAALAGLTYTSSSPNAIPTVQGWPAAAFTETARKHHSTAFEPWNLTSEQSAGFGFVMSETGYLQLGVYNGAGSGTYVDTWSCYIRATLCGSPFDKNTDVHQLARSFAPISQQYSSALKIAGDWASSVAGFVGGGAPAAPAASWGQQLANAQDTIHSFLEAPPPGIGEPLAYDDAAFQNYRPYNG